MELERSEKTSVKKRDVLKDLMSFDTTMGIISYNLLAGLETLAI